MVMRRLDITRISSSASNKSHSQWLERTLKLVAIELTKGEDELDGGGNDEL